MHRAIAALGPEEEVAAALEESAILARARVASPPKPHCFPVPLKCHRVHGIVPDDSSAPPMPPISRAIRYTQKRSWRRR